MSDWVMSSTRSHSGRQHPVEVADERVRGVLEQPRHGVRAPARLVGVTYAAASPGRRRRCPRRCRRRPPASGPGRRACAAGTGARVVGYHRLRRHHHDEQVVVPVGLADPVEQVAVERVLGGVGEDAEAGDGLPHGVGMEADRGQVGRRQLEVDDRAVAARAGRAPGRRRHVARRGHDVPSPHRVTSCEVIKPPIGNAGTSPRSLSDNGTATTARRFGEGRIRRPPDPLRRPAAPIHDAVSPESNRSVRLRSLRGYGSAGRRLGGAVLAYGSDHGGRLRRIVSASIPPEIPPVTSQQTPPRTTTWDNPFLEPPRSTWRVVAAIGTAVVLLLGAISAVVSLPASVGDRGCRPRVRDRPCP